MSESPMTPSQHQAAVARIGENLALRSGAGCGKTFVLARRFTELLMKSAGKENPLSRFVALTFTDKAAMEMSQRVRKIISDFAARSKGDDRRQLLGWLEELPDARISTIHSFCVSLLRSHAIDAGLDPAFSVCSDELVTSAMISQACDDAVLAAVESQRPDVAEILTVMRYDQLLDRVQSLVEDRTAFDTAQYADPGATLARWNARLKAQRDEAWQKLSADASLRAKLDDLFTLAEACTDNTDALFVAVKPQLNLLGQLLADPSARTEQAFETLDTRLGNKGQKNAWAIEPKTVRENFRSLVTGVKDCAIFASELADLDRRAARALATLARLAGEACELYRAEKRRRGLLDFTDLMDYAHRLLAGNPAIRDALRKQFDQLLVDEAQDVDPLQIELLTLLIFGQARLDSPPDGRLFLVGDAKQSIYRFRGARVEVFSDLCNRLGPQKQQNLDLSFRTHEAGVAFANHLFAPLLGKDYSPIQAHRKINPPHPSVEILLAPQTQDAKTTAGEDSASQARLAAQRIRKMLDDGERLVWDRAANAWRTVQPKDVAILFNRMTVSFAYERELALHNIPYYVVAGTGFFKQQEVYDVLNALRVIDNAFDDVALLGTLRGSMFGLDDGVLMHLAETLQPPYLPALARLSEGGEEFFADALPGLSKSQRQTLAFAVNTLLHLHRRKDAVGIDCLVEHIVDATGYEAVLLSQFQGRRMLGNVRRLVDLARGATTLSLADFIKQMNEMVINESRCEQAAVAGSEENVVRLLTVHKAKGLEFPVVILPDLNAGRRGISSPLLNRDDWGLTCKINPSEESQEADDAGEQSDDDRNTPLSFRMARRLENQDQLREEIRRFYVAVTRHEDHLIFVATDKRKKDGEFQKSSSLEILDSVLKIRKAVDAGQTLIPYGDSGFNIALSVAAPQGPPESQRTATPGQLMLDKASSADDLAEAICQSAALSRTGELPLLGSLPPNLGRVEVAVTALGEFELCPMLYRWRYELRAPVPPSGKHTSSGASGMDALTLGTLLHRCMELVDFKRPQPAGVLLAQAAADVDLTDKPGLQTLQQELDGMLKGLASHAIGETLRNARAVHRELDFMLRLPHGILRGQIDLLYQDAGGAWHIVDYKSDRVDRKDLAAHAERYELQMLAYAAAAGRFLGQSPVDAALYFLRPADTHVLALSETRIAEADKRLDDLARQIIVAGRTGQFPQHPSPACKYCPYAELCRK